MDRMTSDDSLVTTANTLRRKISLAMAIEALKTASLVGSIILLINQHEALFEPVPLDLTKALLSYCVPFCVYLYGRLKANNP